MALRAPVAFIVFNRPDLTQIVFNRIREAKPAILFVIADGPRPSVLLDKLKCQEVRSIIDQQVDWECQVIKNYSDINLGCKKRVSSGIDWVFSQTQEAIFLEDDCLVDLSFFNYTDELLEKYKDNPKVFCISADQRYVPSNFPYSYNFIRIPFIWGWASWRRAWAHYDVEMKTWPDFNQSNKMVKLGWKPSSARFYRKHFERVYQNKNDTWDYQWVYTVIKNEGICIQPSKNLIQNIGFREDATHTKFESVLALRKAEALEFPLRHPPEVKCDWEIDNNIQRRYQALWPRVLNKIKTFFS